MKIETLIAGFEGLNNSSKIILDKLDNCKKLYLKNDKQRSFIQIKKELLENRYDQCLILGQKPKIKDKVSIELIAKKEFEIKTNFDFKNLTENFRKNAVSFCFSNRAGNSYCNNVYFDTLNFLIENNFKTQIIFLHLPFIKNFSNIDSLINALKEFLKDDD